MDNERTAVIYCYCRDDKYRPIFGSNISENTLDIVPKQR